MSNNTDLFGIEPINITGTLPTAQLPIIPKSKGGFEQDVSVGLTDGYVAVVSGGQITIGPPPASPSRAQLAILSDPFFLSAVSFLRKTEGGNGFFLPAYREAKAGKLRLAKWSTNIAGG